MLPKKKFLPYEKAEKFAQSLNLKNQFEWKIFCKSGKKPDNIPANPNTTYKNKGFTTLKAWLGNEKIISRNRKLISYKEAQKFASSLLLKSQSEWRMYCKSENKLNNIPVYPDRAYRNKGFVSYAEWLGLNQQYLTYKEAVKTLREYEKI